MQVEGAHDGVDVVGHPVVGVAAGGIVGAAEAAQVDFDDAAALADERRLLVFKDAVGKRPAVHEENGLGGRGI